MTKTHLLGTLICTITAASTVLAQPRSSPAPEGIRYVCSVTTAGGGKQLVFTIVRDKAEARQVSGRQSLGSGPASKVVLVHECIQYGQEKFMDAKAAELLANTPR